MSRGLAIVQQARTYLGTPWRHLGRNRAGVDCVGLVTCVGYDLGITDFTTDLYRRGDADQEAMITPFRQFCDHVMPRDLEPGDIVLFSTARQGHCGIYAGKTFIHAYARSRKVVEELWSVWRDHPDPTIKLVAAFRVR